MNLGQKSNSSNEIKASDSESDSNTWPWKFSEVIHRSRSARHLQAPADVGDQPQQCPKIVNIMLNHDIHHPKVMMPKNVPKGALLSPSKSARYRLGTLYL